MAGGMRQVHLDVAEERGCVGIFVPLVLLIVAEEDDSLLVAEGILEQQISLTKGRKIRSALKGGLEFFERKPRRITGVAERHDDFWQRGKLNYCHLDVRPRAGHFVEHA